MSEESSAPDTNEAPQQVTCPAAKDPAVRLFIVSGMTLAGALWCIWDAYILGHYPYAPIHEDINKFAGWAFNHFLPVILLPVAIVTGVWGYVFLKRVLVANQEGIGYQGKTRYTWDDVTKLDASELAEKKILRLQVKGREKPLVLDAWKLENFVDLVALVEEKVPDDRQTT
jgi:hypothetical protein